MPDDVGQRLADRGEDLRLDTNGYNGVDGPVQIN